LYYRTSCSDALTRMSPDRFPSPALPSVPSHTPISTAQASSPSNSPPPDSPLSSPPSSPLTPPLKQRRLAVELDIGVLVSERCSGRNIEDADKYNLITNHSTPTPADVFPSRNGRRFQLSWLARFKWLRYSKHDMVVTAFLVCCSQDLAYNQC